MLKHLRTFKLVGDTFIFQLHHALNVRLNDKVFLSCGKRIVKNEIVYGKQKERLLIYINNDFLFQKTIN